SRLFLDGNEVAYQNQQALTGALRSVGALVIGNRATGDRGFAGILDEVYACGRALSDAEVLTLASAPPLNDTTPPIITNVVAGGITDVSATITWTTDEPAE